MPVRPVLVAAVAAALALPLAGAPMGAAASGPTSQQAEVPAVAMSNPPSQRQIDKFDLSKKELTQIAKADSWSQTNQAVNSRVCRSGSNFRLVTGIGTGAYQLTGKRWSKYGGRQFNSTAAKSPGFAQKLVAWRLFRDSKWKHLSCPTADWMQVAFKQAKGATLPQMLIPGTHDSGAGLIDDQAPCQLEVIAGASPVFTLAAERNPCVAAELAKAQSQNLGAQLRGGVRYLDLRVGVPASKVISAPKPPAKDPLSVPLVLQHNFVSQPLARGLSQVLDFADSHPKEQIVLDFQHLDQPTDPALSSYYSAALRGYLRTLDSDGTGTVCDAAWSKRIVGADAGKVVNTVSIGDAWKAGRNLLVLMDPAVASSDCYFDRDKVISSPWPNTDVPSVSKTDNDGYLAERIDRLDGDQCTDAEDIYWCGLFVNQVQLTPSPTAYADCVFNDKGDNCSLEALAGLVNDDVAGYMRTWTNQSQPTNIAIVDYYQDADPSIVDRLIRLNWNRTGQYPR